MKKSIWALSAIALLGFGLVGCGGDEGDECTTDLDCDATAGLVCNTQSGVCQSGTSNACAGKCDDSSCLPVYTCSGTVSMCVPTTAPSCTSDQILYQDGEGLLLCISNVDSDDDALCGGGTVDPGNPDVPAPTDYRYVRIDDLSPKMTENDGKEDPGADIDAVGVKQKEGGFIWAQSVMGYNRADGQSSVKDKSIAANPEMALGEPDSVTGYAEKDGKCVYYTGDASDADSRAYTFVSLGGQGGYLIVDMGVGVVDGDVVHVMELGDCELQNTSDGKKSNAKKEKIKVSVSVASAFDSTWKTLGEAEATKGVVTFNVTGGNLQ